MFLFLDFIEVLIGPLWKIFFYIYSSSYFLIYIVCAFYAWMSWIFWENNTLVIDIWFANIFLDWKLFFFNFLEFGPPYVHVFCHIRGVKGRVLYCTCECWYRFSPFDKAVIVEFVWRHVNWPLLQPKMFWDEHFCSEAFEQSTVFVQEDGRDGHASLRSRRWAEISKCCRGDCFPWVPSW